MDEQLKIFPTGLTRSQFDALSDYARRASSMTVGRLLSDADEHVAMAAAGHEQNRLVNLRLATALRDTIGKALSEWESMPEHARYWLAGAVLYFTSGDDSEPDFASPIGFEDDVEVVNACLRFARLDSLCLNPEDYDA